MYCNGEDYSNRIGNLHLINMRAFVRSILDSEAGNDVRLRGTLVIIAGTCQDIALNHAVMNSWQENTAIVIFRCLIFYA